MSNEIDLSVKADGADSVDRIVSAIDRLHEAMSNLGNNSAATRLEEQMKVMQASITAGFAGMAGMAERGGNEVAAATERTSKKLLSIEQQRDVALDKLRQQALTNYVGWWDKMLSIEERRDTEMNAQRAKAAAEYTSWWDKALAERNAIQQKRDIELHGVRAREHADYVGWWDKQLAAQEAGQLRQITLERARDVELRAMRERAAAEAASAAERNRVLNTNFLTASPSAQLHTAEKAQVYLQQPGATRAEANERYGSAAASADINALRAAHERLQQTVPGSTRAVQEHGDAMREAHSLARGLAGSLGGLWLTYGSLVPLVAGAAIAASLKNVVVVGKEVENQLNFVQALGNGNVDLNKFLTITDSSLSSIVESANAMRMLAQNGLQAGQALQVLPALLDLALVGEMDVGQAALAVTGAVSAFGLGIGEAGRVADIFARTAANSNTSVVAITESMKQASTSASLFKVSIEETAGVLGVLAKINVTGGAAGTAMTNMLTGLYEPTEKGKKALRELGLETKTSTGALKPFTEVMEEMRMKLASFNDSAKVDLLGSIFTARGVKAAMQVQENLGSYIEKVNEAKTATGFMRSVVEQLENSTTGAFTRLGVTVQNSFVRAFTEANPYIQQIGLNLTAAFAKGSAADTGLSNFATNVARMTGALVENAGVVSGAALGYVGLRLAYSQLAPVVTTAMTATAAATAATEAAAVANAVHATAMSAGAATTATLTAATEASAAATVTATAATAAWEAVLLPALAALGVALAAGAALWLLFRDNTTEADKGNVKISNSLHVIEEALKKEEERLERVIALWDERNARFGDDKSVSPKTIEAARTQVSDIETLIKKEGLNPEDVRKGNNTTQVETRVLPNGDLMEVRTSRVSRYAEALREADKNLQGLTAAEAEYNSKVKPQQELEAVNKLKAQTMLDLKQFYLLASERNTKGELYQPNDKIRAIELRAAPLMEELVDPKKMIKGDLTAETERVNRLRTSLQQLKDEVNSLQGGRAPKPDKQALGADLANLQHEIDLQRQLSQSQTFEARQQYARGEIGDIQLINTELKAKLDLRAKEVDVLGRQAAAASAADKPAKQAAFLNKQDLSAKQDGYDRLEAEEKIATKLKQMQGETVAAEAKSLADKGQLVEAFNLEYEAKYGDTLRRVNTDIFNSTDAGTKAVLVKYRDMLMKMEADGQNAALGKQLGNEIAQSLSALDQAFNRVSNDAAGGSIGQMLSGALAAAKALDEALPGLAEKQRALQAQADESGDPEDQTRANKALKDIDSAAGRMRKVWTDVGAAIGKSLGGAFDRAGKSVGLLVTAYTSYGAKQKQIQDNLTRDKAATDDPVKRLALEKKASEDMAATSIKAYGDMAGAAKGFFKEKTGAYRVLEAAEKAFRAYEIAMEIKNFAVKSGLVSAFTGLFVANKATQTVAEGAQTAASTAMAGTQASAWGITAVVKAIASMPFPYNLIAGAATLAAVVGIGAKVVGSLGGGGSTMAKDRQAANGTGSILGDDKAKSESISKALDRIKDSTYQGLNVSIGMLNSLRAIEAGISGVGTILGQNGVSGEGPATLQGGGYRAGQNAVRNPLVAGFIGGPVGLFVSALDRLTGGWISKTSGQIANAIFGGKTKAEDIGLTANRTTVAGALAGGMTASSYADMKRDGGFFRSDKTWTDTKGLGAEANQQFTMIVKGMADTITQSGQAMGLSAADVERNLNSFIIDIGKISTKDLKPEEIQKQLEAAFSKVGDDMARWAIGDLTKFQKVGEGAFETLARVAQDYQAIDVVFASIGKTFGQVGMESINARERLIELSGGLDEFLSQGSYFLENFYTKQEQATALARRVQPTLGKYGLSATGPDAMKQFRAYIEALEASGPAGAVAYAELIKLAPALKSIADAAEEVVSQRNDLQDEINKLMLTEAQLRAKERNELDATNRALYDQLQAAKAVAEARDRMKEAYEQEKSSIEGTIDRLGNLADSWKDFQHDLVMGDNSPLTPQQKYQAAQAKYNETLQKARGGDTAAQDAFQSVAQDFLDASRVVNSSGSAYSRDFDGVLQATQENEAWARVQVDAAKSSLDVLKKQAATLVSIDEKVGTWAEELNNFMRAQADFMQKQATASAPPMSPEAQYTQAVNQTARDPAEKKVLDDILAQIEALREQQAQENADNVDATYGAAQEMAQAQEAAAAWTSWQERNTVNTR